MASIVTGVIGGIQARNAAKDAAKAQELAAQAAGDIFGQATANAAPILQGAYDQAGSMVDAAAKSGAAGVTSTSDSAANAVLDAVKNAQTGVYDATGKANAYLDPYSQAGQQALTKLSDLANAKFTFNPDEDPGYQFRLAEGQKALERSAAARGGSVGGGALKELARYSQGVASQEYQAAFDRFRASTNDNRLTLANLAGMGLTAGGQAGQNLTSAARYSGDIGLQGNEFAGGARMNAAQFAANLGQHAADFQGNARLALGSQLAQNTINEGEFRAGTKMKIGDAQASGHIGAANAWNSMLGSIGSGVNSMIAGGFQSGSFKLGDMAKYGLKPTSVR